MSSKQKNIISSDEDDDYELPSLSERIKASLVLEKQKISSHVLSDSEDTDSSFLKFSQRIRNTPCSQVKLDFSTTSESEDEELQFLRFSQRIQSTPQVKIVNTRDIERASDSDDELFSNLSERLNIMTPRTENKENYNIVSGHDAVNVSEFHTPLPIKKKVSEKAMDSDSDESFSNFVDILRTPMSIKKTPKKAVNSESDESFSSFVEGLRTPLSVNRRIQNKENESGSDDSFLKSCRKQSFHTPKSQKKAQNNVTPLFKIPEVKQKHSFLTIEDTPNSLNLRSLSNENEFKALFQPESISEMFLRKRESYTHKLYEFYNKKVFNLRLPPDMPLFYDGALKTTAGITCCFVKNGAYYCSIKLSSSILISFDRLKQTLLHEMCHAAVHIVNKQRHVHHGPLWQVWASRCKLILPFIECPRRCHNYEISYNVWYQCSTCKWKKGRCKQVTKYHGALCKRCKTPITVTYT